MGKTELLLNIFSLCGGLALFLYGISTLSDGLEKIAGGKLEKILKKMTSNPVKSFALGVGITALIQSSSAVTVMLVGLVNSGIMDLSQTVSVIIGSNVGTTITAWLLSLTGIKGQSIFIFLKPESFSPILALIGVIMIMAAKTNKRKNIGMILMGFAILMFGMMTMAASMAPLTEMPECQNLFLKFQNPILAMLVGLIVTMVIQSSSASIGILQALSLAPIGISYGMAIPIILGQNLGTCISAVLSAIGVNTNAKRVAAIHVIYNIICVGIALPLFIIGCHFIDKAILDTHVTPFNIAVIHTVYNIITAFVAFPFFKGLEKLAIWAIPDKGKNETDKIFLDEKLLHIPGIAIEEVYQKTLKMANVVEFNYIYSTKMLKHFIPQRAEQIRANEITIDTYEDILNKFLIKVSGKDLQEDESNRVSQLMLAIGDIERIGDHTSHILKIAERLNESEHKLSETAIEELKVIVNAVLEIYTKTIEAYSTNNEVIAQEIEPLEVVIKKIVRRVKNNHIQRVKDGECLSEMSFDFTELLTDFRRIAAHCGNIAISIIQLKDVTVTKHSYNNRNKEDDMEYINKYKNYKSRYSVKKLKEEV